MGGSTFAADIFESRLINCSKMDASFLQLLA
jgi:hypothetical protein